MSDLATVEDVARFCAGPSAVGFALAAKTFGLDPAMDVDDDYLAWQLRLGLAERLAMESKKPRDEDPHTAAVKARERVGAKVREMRGGR